MVIPGKLRFFLLVILLLTVIFSSVLPAYAQDEEGRVELQEKLRGRSAAERIFAGIIASFTQSLYELLGIRDPLELIFDYKPLIGFRGEEHYQPRSELYLGLFGKTDGGLIADMYNYLIRYSPILFTIILSVIGLYLVIFATTSDTRVNLKDLMHGIIAGLFALAIGPYLMDFIFDVVYAGVEVVKHFIDQKLTARGMETPKSLIGVMIEGLLVQAGDHVRDGIDVNVVLSGITSLGYIVVIFVVFLGAGIINFQYIMRKITIALLIIIFPVVAMVSVLPTRRRALQTWFTEFIASASLVLIHAVVYGFLILTFTTVGRAFNVFETAVYILGISTITAYIRRIFGANSGGFISNAAGIAGLGAVIGLMGLGKAGFLSRDGLVSQTNNQVGQEIAGASHRDIKSIIGQGRDITPSQASLMAGQMSATSQRSVAPTSTVTGVDGFSPGYDSENLTSEMSEPFYAYDTEDYVPPAPATEPEVLSQPGLDARQRMELEGPQKDLAITPPEKPKSAFMEKAGRVAQGTAIVTGALVGGLISGTATGKQTAGLGIGATAGGLAAKGAGRVVATGGHIIRAARNPNSMGIYTFGQFLDPKSAVQIGRNIAGTPGAVAAGTIGYATNAGARVSAFIKGETYTNPAKQIRKQIDQQYQEAYKQYQEAQQMVQLAEYNLQQHELGTPVPERNEEYYAKHKELQRIRDEEVRKFHIQRLAFKEAENIKANEHHYVGIELKMQELKRQHHSRGDINGHEWRQ